VDLTGKRKAAILLACLGPERASQVLAELQENEVDQITLDISSMNAIDPELKSSVMDEFQQMAQAKQNYTQGGNEYAKNLL
jgi:flagellar motor switch protein FliG